ncbi:MAG: nitroreductase family protein [Candidatus Caldarchaeum sp.]
MDVLEAIRTKLELKEYDARAVPKEVVKEIFEAARLSPSGLNSQHWRFIYVDAPEDLKTLAEISLSGKWVSGCSFAVIVLTSPKYPWHLLDAGRVITYMQLAAWNRGVGSRIYTGYDEKAMRMKFGIPSDYHIACVVGFGYPRRKVLGRKNRQPVESLVFHGRMGTPIGF